MRRWAAEGEGESAAPRKEFDGAGAVGQAGRQAGEDGRYDGGFALRGGLEEGARGEVHAVAGENGEGGRLLEGGFGGGWAEGAGDAGDGVRGGESSEFFAVGRGERAVEAQQEVGAGLCEVGEHGAAAAQGGQAGEGSAERSDQGEQTGVEDFAGGEVDDVGGMGAVQAERDATLAALGGELHAPPGFCGCADQGADNAGFHAGPDQRIDDKAALPGGIGVVGPVLDGAAAAALQKMRAGWVDPLRAGVQDRQDPGALAAGIWLHAGAFAGQGARHMQRWGIGPECCAVAGRADAIDRDIDRVGRPVRRPRDLRPPAPAHADGAAGS